MKRFWDTASLAETAAGYEIRLDDKPMRIPGGPPLLARTLALAAALRDEWQLAGGAKGGEFRIDQLALTRLAGTAQERIAPDPAPVIDALAAYGETDLLCYRATAPAPLVRRQAEQWQPWLDWAARALDAPLRVTAGIIHVAQEPSALGALRRAVAARTPEELAGLSVIIPSLGSLVLGLALAEGLLDSEAAHRLSLLDELFQEELWGLDHEAAARRATVATDLAQAALFVRLGRG